MSDDEIIEFADAMSGAWCCGTSKRGYRTAWERERRYPHMTRHVPRDYGADVRIALGEYVATRWKGTAEPIDVWLRDKDGKLRHVATVDSLRVRDVIERDSEIAGRMNYPIVPGRFTERLPIGAAFVEAGPWPATVYRVVSRGKKRMIFSPIRFEDLKPGETLHAPSPSDFQHVLAARPTGNCENNLVRRRMTEQEKALISSGVELVEYDG